MSRNVFLQIVFFYIQNVKGLSSPLTTAGQFPAQAVPGIMHF